VRFVLKRDRQNVFRFASLQSDFAARILASHGLSPGSLDTVYVVLHYNQPAERLFARSDAVLAVLQRLGHVCRATAGLGRALPLTIRDFFYNLIARNRYRIFGMYDTCPLPTPEQQAKFLDQ
jgi:predicted DCC family thiol-disulfide oxidoreductase YuxK